MQQTAELDFDADSLNSLTINTNLEPLHIIRSCC